MLALALQQNFFFRKEKGNEVPRAPGKVPEKGKGGHTFQGRLFEPRVAHEQQAELSTRDSEPNLSPDTGTQILPRSRTWGGGRREERAGQHDSHSLNLTTRRTPFPQQQQPRRANGAASGGRELRAVTVGRSRASRYPEKG